MDLYGLLGAETLALRDAVGVAGLLVLRQLAGVGGVGPAGVPAAGVAVPTTGYSE